MRGPKTLMSLLCTWLLAAACAGAKPPPNSATEPEPASGTAQSGNLTAEACEASGGTVVGDIGDGAIHRPDYRCASGAKPTGAIRVAEGGPIAVDGSVCCPK